MSTITLQLGITPELRRSTFAASGLRVPESVRLELEAADLSPKAREILVRRVFTETNGLQDGALLVDVVPTEPFEPAWAGLGSMQPSRRYYESRIYPTNAASWELLLADYDQACVAAETALETWTNEAIDRWLSYWRTRLEDGTDLTSYAGPHAQRLFYPSSWQSHPRHQEIRDLAGEVHTRAAAARLEEAQRQEARSAAQEAAKAAEERERSTWIEVHGSERLKLCFKQGYNCQRLYALERARHEYPYWALDFNHTASYEDRAGPSLQALTRAQQTPGATIVWLTCLPSSEPDADPEELEVGIEALRLASFLGKYDLYQTIVP